MQRHELIQGSPQWLAHRAQCWNASDAPAMMGCSPYKTRTQLLDEVARGFAAEVDAGTQKRFDDGHRFEALARPLGEKVIGEDLSPLSGSIDAGLSRPLAASFDGITFMADFAWEHKSLNDDLRAVLPDHGIGDTSVGAALPLLYRVQMEQQAAVSGAGRVLFTASKWRGDELIEARHCWYQPDPALREQILAGWRQFERDLAEHKPAAAEVKPIGATPETLPALRIEVTGMVTASNLDAFKKHALQVVDSINRDLQTDQDFADAEATVKWCKGVEEKLATAKANALAQTESIDALFRTMDDVGAEFKRVRLELDKLVTARKDAIRTEIVVGAQQQLRAHVAELLAGLPRPAILPAPAADFAAVIKGKRSVDSIRDAVATLLASAKAEASQTALRVRANLDAFNLLAADRATLFPDLGQLALKPSEDFSALVQGRLAQHEAEQRAAQERAAVEAARREQTQREAQAAEQQRQAAAAVAAQQAVQVAAAPAPAPIAAPAAAEPSTLPLGEVCARLGFTVTADFLAGLGFEAQREGAAKRYRPSDFPRICEAISKHVLQLRTKTAEPLAA